MKNNKSPYPQRDSKQTNKKSTNMNKFLVYTSNLPEMPKDMSDVIQYAQETPKFYISSVELNGCLSEVKEGDHIITKKGNNLYVIRALQDNLENLSEDDRNYLEDLKRKYGLKTVNITSVAQIIKFETWCKSAKVIVKTEEKTMKNSIKGISSRIKEMFMPTEAKGIRVSTNGELAVETENGYVAIDSNNKLISYPEELTFDVPVYLVSKPIDQLQAGDVIETTRGYAKVTKIDGDDKISAISYTGAGRTIHTTKDFVMNQTVVRVVVSMTGTVGGQINPAFLLAMSESESGEDKESLLPFLMMSQSGGNLSMNMNPMMAYAFLGKKSGNMKDLLMMSALSGGNGFGNIFGGNTTAQAPKAKVTAKKKAAKKNVRRKPVATKKAEEAPVVDKAKEDNVAE